ncbi:hypothetical protein [Roseovarius sp.]|uniref:hypothetical protein n=1 Tax=Roseovarius sp. TaxID=1486281 RepID=UPI0035656DB7
MELGVVVIDDRCGPHAVGLLAAARDRGWKTRCFLTDRGVFLLEDESFRALLDTGDAHFSICELSVERYAHDGVSVEGMEDQIVVGGQYQNAELVRNCDHVVVF